MRETNEFCYDMNQYEYAETKIRSEILKAKISLQISTPQGKIGICFFDKMRFDKDLSDSLKKKYGETIKIQKIWKSILDENELYAQQEFLENTYGHKFKKCVSYNSYGVAFFYANNIENNPEAAIELLTSWFYNVLIPNYNKAIKKYNKIFPLIKDEFVYKQIWSPILRAVMHFDSNITQKSAAKYIFELSKKENMNVKIIDDYQIIYKE